MTYALELKDLRKSFGKTEIIRGVNLAVLPGERVALLPVQPDLQCLGLFGCTRDSRCSQFLVSGQLPLLLRVCATHHHHRCSPRCDSTAPDLVCVTSPPPV